MKKSKITIGNSIRDEVETFLGKSRIKDDLYLDYGCTIVEIIENDQKTGWGIIISAHILNVKASKVLKVSFHNKIPTFNSSKLRDYFNCIEKKAKF
jgi:hypothetical protein